MSPAPRPLRAGERFGRLTVTKDRQPGETFVEVRCDCGTEKSVRFLDLGRYTKSCGCLRTELLVERSTRHGHAGTSLYMTWEDMVARCTRPSHKKWADYGGRGITVCDRWRDFANFLADMGERPPGLELDRIDNNRGYEPNNCRWTDRSTQMKNRRDAAYAGTVRDELTGRFLPKGDH
ncbi:hypothetical protein [Streptomyces carpinensis]|uniref:HNH endonuclease n=1 Tax=Streptomyces carpinensis TaxID=66369 RepID=A0ABV1VVN4_9ACTN|nr:hypothetical protein [Streptomyces carpinensis]